MHTPSFLTTTALLLAALGCRDDDESPMEPAPVLPQATATATTVVEYWQMSAGGAHTCGVTTDSRTFCWGNNGAGQLGGGSSGSSELIPTRIAGGLQFRQVSAGSSHTCGVTPSNEAYCWGANESGQLGDGTTTNRATPTAISGARQFRQVEAGSRHTCGVTTDNLAFCWGDNEYGQLGDGTTTSRLVPRAVAGARRFRQVVAGAHFWSHTCGVTTEDRAFCWGSNNYGQLGDSTEVAFAPETDASSRRAPCATNRRGRASHLCGHHQLSGLLLGERRCRGYRQREALLELLAQGSGGRAVLQPGELG